MMVVCEGCQHTGGRCVHPGCLSQARACTTHKPPCASRCLQVAQPYAGPALAWHPVTAEMTKMSYNSPDCVKGRVWGGVAAPRLASWLSAPASLPMLPGSCVRLMCSALQTCAPRRAPLHPSSQPRLAGSAQQQQVQTSRAAAQQSTRMTALPNGPRGHEMGL